MKGNFIEKEKDDLMRVRREREISKDVVLGAMIFGEEEKWSEGRSRQENHQLS